MRRIPSIKHLRTKDILAFLKEWGSELYLQPKKKKAISEKWNRKWLCQIAQTLHPTDFRKLVGTTMTERRERLLEKRGLFVSTAPEIAEAIERTKLFSCRYIDIPISLLNNVFFFFVGKKGKAAAMVARNKKRRRVVEDSGDEEMKEMERTEIADLQQKNEDLMAKV